ncbi:hypothetical protein [Methylobacterium oxalidis]|uniref:hypothetical protein n=1 Tax=Methylobacterium oxalidis TaxID=944322 RepID=UPI0011BD8503|nr:hypothetical protein [Methylobacterium oxalidis]
MSSSPLAMEAPVPDFLLNLPPTQAMAVCGLAPVAIFAAIGLLVEGARFVALALGYKPEEL